MTPLTALLMALPSSLSIVPAKLSTMPPVSASSAFIWATFSVILACGESFSA